MGWGHCGTDSTGREIGYCIDATCDHQECRATIHRGLSYVCGKMHGDSEFSCEKYFCGKHRTALFIEDYVDKEREQGLYNHLVTYFHGLDGLFTCFECYKMNEKALTEEIDHWRIQESERSETA